MHRTLAIVGLLALLVVLGSAAHPVLAPSSGTVQQAPTGVRVADLPLGRHVHGTILVPTGSLAGGGPFVSIPLPPSFGIAIASIAVSAMGSGGAVEVIVDGVLAARIVPTTEKPHEFNPPLLVRPGATLQLTSPGGAHVHNFSGYIVLNTDL